MNELCHKEWNDLYNEWRIRKGKVKGNGFVEMK